MVKLKKFWPLILCALLLAACSKNMASLSVANNPTSAASIATPIPTKRTSVTKSELTYPGATWVRDEEVFPAGMPLYFESTNPLGAFITNDSQAQIRDFYQKKLKSLGLDLVPNYGCSDPVKCKEIYLLFAQIMECDISKKYCSQTYQVQVLIVSAKATTADDFSHTMPLNWYDLAKRGRNLVLFAGDPYHPFTPSVLTSPLGQPDQTVSPKPVITP